MIKKTLALIVFLLLALSQVVEAQQTITPRRISFSTGCNVTSGTGTPEGAVVGSPCDLYLRTDGTTGTTFYRKETGTATNTGWVSTQNGFAPPEATYITQTVHSGLSNEQALGALASALLVNTTTTGVLSAYTGTACTNQFVRSLSALGVSTCATVSLTADVTGTLAATNGGTGQASFVVGDVLYASTTTALSRLAAGAAGTFFRFAGAGVAPVVSTLVLPNAATANQIAYATATDTLGGSATLNFDGSALMVGTNTAGAAGAGDIRANDAIYERGRTVPIGQWITVAYSAGNFTAADGATWTVDSGDVLTNQYTLIGTTMIWTVRIDTTSIAASPLPTALRITIPGGCASVVRVQDSAPILDNAATQTESGIASHAVAGTFINVFRANIGATFSASTNMTGFRFTIAFEVSGC